MRLIALAAVRGGAAAVASLKRARALVSSDSTSSSWDQLIPLWQIGDQQICKRPSIYYVSTFRWGGRLENDNFLLSFNPENMLRGPVHKLCRLKWGGLKIDNFT